MKQGKIFWFKSDVVTPDTTPRGVIDVSGFIMTTANSMSLFMA